MDPGGDSVSCFCGLQYRREKKAVLVPCRAQWKWPFPPFNCETFQSSTKGERLVVSRTHIPGFRSSQFPAQRVLSALEPSATARESHVTRQYSRQEIV